MFVDDLMADLLKLFLYMTGDRRLFLFAWLHARPRVDEQRASTTYSPVCDLGMMVMISANHFLTIYIGLELLSLSLYAMVAMNRDSVVSTEAAMKYFVLARWLPVCCSTACR
jgi:NADH-quinone oxidoreductase subunit N